MGDDNWLGIEFIFTNSYFFLIIHIILSLV